MRSGEASITRSSRPRTNFFLRCASPICTNSPGSTSGTNTVWPSWCANPSPPYTSFSIRTSTRRSSFDGRCDPWPEASGQVEQTQAGKIIALPQTLRHVLPFELRELRGVHFSPVGSELAIHLAANLKQEILRRAGEKARRQFVFQNRQPAFKVFK